MNTRLATVAAALAAFQIAALASQASDEPELFEAGTPVAAVANGLQAWTPAGDALPQPLTGLSGAVDLCFAADGTLFLSDEGADVVLRCDAGGALLGALGAGTDLDQPAGLALGPAGALYVASRGTDSVLVFDAEGAPAGELGADAGLAAPWGLAFDARGRLHVASSGGDEVAVLDPSGARVETIGAGELSSPRGLCFGRDGRLYVADHDGDRIAVFDDGLLDDSLDAEGTLGGPVGLAFGPDGLLYVAAASTGTVLALHEDGSIAGVLPAANALPALSGLAFAPQMLRANVKGLVQRPGEPRRALKGAGLLALRPGALPVSLSLLDPDGSAAQALGAASVFFGAALESASPAFDGLQLGPAAAQRGLLSLHLDLKLRTEPAPAGTSAAQPSKAAGPLHGATPGVIVDADLRSGKRLN